MTDKPTERSLTRSDVKVLNTRVRGYISTAWLVEITGKHYIISALNDETLAFAADERGDVTNFADQAMVPRADHEACIANLLETLGGAA